MFKNFEYIYLFFGPIIFTLISTIINIYIIDWNLINNITGYIYLFIQGLCAYTSSEIPLKSLLLLIYKKNKIKHSNNVGKTSFVINYNLKASDKKEIDICFLNMYEAFLGNMTENSCAVLISATVDNELKQYETEKLEYYKKLLYNEVRKSCIEYLKHNNDNCWLSYLDISLITLLVNIDNICNKRCDDFILLRRNSNVLKKCGQYQDLITLSMGYNIGYTYKNKLLYGSKLREIDQPLFVGNDPFDVIRIINKKIEYTIVLDYDTTVPKGEGIKLICSAIENTEYDIIQPSIKLNNTSTLFQSIQVLWQEHSNKILDSTCLFLNHSTFFGKGLIRNKEYFMKCIGTPDNLIEYVPSNVLSHDTFEAMAVTVLYDNNVIFNESPPETFVGWHIRELRWNIGELIVFQHMYPKLMFRNKSIHYTKHNYNISFIKKYVALSSCRVIFMRPILLIYILLSIKITMKYSYIPMLYMLFTILILPNILTFNIRKPHHVFIILITSIIQFTPEPIIGTVRFIQAMYYLFKSNVKWIPSYKIEKNINDKGIWYYSFLYFGIYSLISGIIISYVYYINPIITFFLLSIIILPFYSGITGKQYKTNKFRIGIRKNNN